MLDSPGIRVLAEQQGRGATTAKDGIRSSSAMLEESLPKLEEFRKICVTGKEMM
jgi:hypothetical protein